MEVFYFFINSCMCKYSVKSIALYSYPSYTNSIIEDIRRTFMYIIENKEKAIIKVCSTEEGMLKTVLQLTKVPSINSRELK